MLPRVLLIAEACNPEWVSVPLEGWSHTHAISRVTRSHLVTQIRNRDAILRTGLKEGQDFTAIDSEAVTKPIYNLATRLRGGSGKGWTTLTALMSLAYPYFEWLVWKQFGPAISRGDYDVVHRITPLTPTSPSLLAKKCHRAGVPFVLGPLNGGVPWPKDFDGARRQEKEWLSYVRSAYRILPGYRATRKYSSAIICGSMDTFKLEPTRVHDKCIYIPENAIDPTRFSKRRTRQASHPIRVVFVGRLVPYKGADMLIQAAKDFIRAGQLEVTIIGDGPQMPSLKEFADQENLGAGLVFRGWVEHAKLQDELCQMDVFGFPSIREFGGGAVIEAMAIGVVPIVVSYGGPGEIVTPKTGFAVPIGSRESIIAGYTKVFESLIANPNQIDHMSGHAFRRAHELFTWESKARQVLEVYRWLLDKNLPKPNNPCPLTDPST